MRKVLSFVLVLALVLSSFSMAFAGTEAQNSLSDIAGHANEEAITVDFNLGIIDGMGDGTFAPDQAVNRAQFAAMMTRALAIPDSALAGYTATSFKDTTGYSWAVPYLAYCQSKGILVGDGNGNVMPGRTVSVNEAMTMVLRAVGYTNNSAALVGVWPANYVSLAQNNSLYDDVATAVGVTRANAAQIIYNALTVDKVEVASDGKTTVLSDRSNDNESKWKIVNMLTTGLNCYAESLTIQGDEETQINLKAYIGQTVTAFLNSDDEIVAIYSVDSDSITGEFEKDMSLEMTGNAIRLITTGVKLQGDDDVDYTLELVPDTFTYIINGDRQTTTAAGATIASDASIAINGKITGKTIKDIYSITTWVESNAKKVKTADINSLKDQSLLGSDFTTLKDGSIDKNSFELIGVKSLDDIKADNIVAVYEKGTDGKGDIIRVEVGTKVVEGKVTTTKDSNKKIVVSGTTYEQSDLDGSKDITKIEAGDDVKLYLDSKGDVYTYDQTSGSNDKYAAVMDTDTKYDKVKLYTTDDDSAWYELTGDDAKAATFVTNNGIDNFGLVAYGVNNKGKIDTATTTGVYHNATQATLSGLTLQVNNAGGSPLQKSFKVDSDCVVYGIDTITDHEIDNYVKIGEVDTGKPLGPIAYFVDEDNIVVAMLVDSTHTNATADDSYAVVSEVNSTTNADGDSVDQVIGFMDGAALDKLTNDKGTAKGKDALGVLWKVNFDSDGLIKDFETPDQAAGVITHTLTNGITVSAIDDNNIMLTGAGVGIDDTWLPVAPDAKVYRAVLDKDGALDVYKLSDVSSINTNYRVWLYNTVDDDDSKGADGYDVVIYLTKADADKL